MDISKYIPPHTRKPVYGTFAVVGVTIGAIQVGFAAADVANPTWLTVALAVFPFVAGAVGFTAQAATDTSGPRHDPTDVPEVIEREPDELDGAEDLELDEEFTDDEIDELLAEQEVDLTPVPDDYEPQH